MTGQQLTVGSLTEHNTSRAQQLRMLGNGVVAQQAVAAIRLLLARAEGSPADV